MEPEQYIREQVKLSKELFQNKIRDLQRLFAAEVKSIRSDVVVAKRTSDAETKKANEFRQTLKDQAATLATRREFEQVRDQMTTLATRSELQTVKERADKGVTRTELVAAVIAILTIVISLFTYFK